MTMLLHELHPSVVHAPLTLLPAATVADLIAVTTGDRAWAKVGRRLWVAGTVSALFSGLAGLASSQEVKLEDARARDMVFLHGMGNAVITLGAVGVTLWRLGRPPSLGQALVGLMINTLMSADESAEGGDIRNIYKVGLNTSRLLMVLGDVVCAWLLLKGAEVALEKLSGEVSAKDKAFYEGKVAAAQFFAQTNLPRLTAERAIAEATDLSVMDLDEASF